MLKERKLNKGKAVAAATAVGLCAAIVLGGTFAWQSISQTAKNEVSGQVLNPGGRLHDDFNGSTKNVYVENFGEENLFVRIRLDEYLELGEGAGTAGADRTNFKILGNPDAQFDDPSTWTTHIPTNTLEDCNAPIPDFHDYFEWTLGGKTVYMPTFDKNKDSLDADINGTLSGGGTGNPYGDYIEYKVGDKELGEAIYDADDNTVQDGNVTSVREEHTAKETLESTVISMDQWIRDGRQPGNFWVYDVDGWAYWANPIAPKSATGPLLSAIKQVAEPDKDWYYSINVVAQFATSGDWGKENGTGFYDTQKGNPPTANAEILLNKIAGLVDVTISVNGAVTTVEPNQNYTFTATAKIAGTSEVLANQEFEWSVSSLDGSTISSSITENGELTVDAGDDLKQLVIKATIKNSNNYGTYLVQVNDSSKDAVDPDKQ